MVHSWHEHLAGWPQLPASFQLDPVKTALIVVDMQRHAADPEVGICRLLKDRYPESAEYFLNRLQRTTIPAIQRLLVFFRERKLRVIYLCVGPWYEDGSDLTPRRRKRDLLLEEASGHRTTFHHGHPVHEIIRELAPQEGELLLHKTTSSAFHSTGLHLLLRNLGIEYLVFTGFATQACVETTARDAADLGFFCVLLDDGCITFTQAVHEATLLNFAATFGRVDDSDTVIAELSGRERL